MEISGNIELQELEKEECIVLRELWEEVFFQDSKEFTDYYFEEKAVRNHGFALYLNNSNKGIKEGQGCRGDDYVAMLYLSPYEMMLRTGNEFESREINYIVGVATKEKYRHRGYMDRLLKAAFMHMFHKKQPFTFLMPANAKIYEPYQFVYIYDREEYAEKIHISEEHWLKESEIPQILEFAAAVLQLEKDVYIKRSEEYYKVLIKELRAQNGHICPLYDRGEIKGYYQYTEESGKREIQEAIIQNSEISSPIFPIAEKTPAIMARIIHVQEMLELLRITEIEIMLTIQIQDSIINQNSGKWRWNISPKKSCISPCAANDKSLTDCRISVDKLTAWIFGYLSTEECFEINEALSKEVKSEVLCKLNQVQLLKKVFINEIV